MVRLLIHAGAKVDAVSYILPPKLDMPAVWKCGNTPLHCAALYGHQARMGLLVQHGADVNAYNLLLGMTPLHMAACCNHEKAVRVLLVEVGADANIKCNVGNTARDMARKLVLVAAVVGFFVDGLDGLVALFAHLVGEDPVFAPGHHHLHLRAHLKGDGLKGLVDGQADGDAVARRD